jgi:flagellar hook assembly protein FlgD
VTLHDGVLEQGRHWLMWNGRNDAGRQVATGVYLTRMTTPAGGSHVVKMMLMK